MKKRKPFLLIILSILLLVCGAGAFAQKSRVGLSLGAEKSSTSDARTIFGVSYEYLFNKLSLIRKPKHFTASNGLEIGLYYRSIIDDNLVVYIPSGTNFVISEQFFVLEKFLSIPVLYNYRTNVLNISIGFSTDIYIGWKEKDHIAHPSPGTFVSLQDYKFDNKILWGAIAKLGKSFRITGKLLLEPSVYYNPIFTPYSLYSKFVSEKRQFYGATINAKYIF